jgi:hypothetical protein
LRDTGAGVVAVGTLRCTRALHATFKNVPHAQLLRNP